VSASIGAGHDGAAAELDRGLTALGLTVDRFDLLDLLPAHLGRLVRDGYHRMLVQVPWAYQRIYAGTERAGGGGVLARALLRTAEERLLDALRPGTGAVVSTYPGASRVLGGLRLGGRLTVPVLTYLTDFSVHPLWVADGVDVHLAAHAVPAAQSRATGAQDVRVCGPVTDPRFRPGGARERITARRRFGLPDNSPLALLVSGSWGVGPVRQVALELRDCGAALPVVVCGHNETLAAQLRAAGIEHRNPSTAPSRPTSTAAAPSSFTTPIALPPPAPGAPLSARSPVSSTPASNGATESARCATTGGPNRAQVACFSEFFRSPAWPACAWCARQVIRGRP